MTGSDTGRIAREQADRAGRVLAANRRLQATLALEAVPAVAIDILLFLAAEDRGNGVTTSRCCGSVAAPRTTALRWIGALAAAGLVEQVEDLRDRRVTLLRLSGRAAAALATWLDELTAGQPIADGAGPTPPG